MDDSISRLPDEILVSILSHLTMHEAARTSVLSQRWTYLWTFTSGSLNFDGPKAMWKISSKERLEVETCKFVGWVNRVLKLHQGPTLDEFMIRFQLDVNSSCHIDEWVNFAVAKRVKILVLDMSGILISYLHPSDRYTFPHKCFLHIKSPCYLSFINNLTSFTLKHVNISEEILEYFLVNCINLKRFSMFRLGGITNLKVKGSLQLKYLEIFTCCELESVEISAPNLVSLLYDNGHQTILRIWDAPRLVDISFLGETQSLLLPISKYLLQLHTLKLELHLIFCEDLEFPMFSELKNLRHLTWRVRTDYQHTLLGLTSMIEASPFLHRFTLELDICPPKQGRKKHEIVNFPNKHLKVVEFFGFVGRTVDMELAQYLLGSAVNLEKIVINPYLPPLAEFKSDKGSGDPTARIRAQKLKSKVPPGAELIIL